MPRTRRPAGVLLVACFQLLKGGVLLVTAALLRTDPERVSESSGVVTPLLYVAMRGSSSVLASAKQGGYLLPTLILVLGLYVAGIGLGILSMKQWARRSILVTTAMTVVLYAKGILLPIAVATARPDLRNVHLLLIVDAITFVYLARGSMGERFSQFR